MRKNQVDRKGLKLIYTTYEIKGLNLDRLINVVEKRGITLYDVKKTSNKRLVLSVNFISCGDAIGSTPILPAGD